MAANPLGPSSSPDSREPARPPTCTEALESHLPPLQSQGRRQPATLLSAARPGGPVSDPWSRPRLQNETRGRAFPDPPRPAARPSTPARVDGTPSAPSSNEAAVRLDRRSGLEEEAK
ncbi:hypothetical protein NDU88_003125 [Pleurodeles waltl]|uniref:Uncharacterized protein n=1 Tax=Pleurodeles waltl TaxID=8319 RepID=A0AAV7PB81_PLEWA|nr:hypothetical protein NDU88_003125 [Pleurodeles waltl]